MIKKNIKVVLVFILGVFCAVGITFAYSVSSKNILINKIGWNVSNVEEAVGYLKDKNRCAGLSASVAYVVSGDKNTVGSVVRIGEEDFYVIGQGTGDEAGKTKLLTKYIINNNVQSNSGGDYNTFYKPFATANYWGNAVNNDYIYNSSSNLYPIVNDYLKKIRDLGVSSAEARLLTYSEAVNLPTNIKDAGDYYWTGTSNGGTNGVYYVYEGSLSVVSTGYDNWFGVRPVILVPTKKIANAQ